MQAKDHLLKSIRFLLILCYLHKNIIISSFSLFYILTKQGRLKSTGQIVAMKFISKVNKTQKEIRNLRTEIDILRKLNHENIIMLLDTFETENDFVMVTEFGEVCEHCNFQVLLMHHLSFFVG